jgi:hypothetical protein
MTSQLNYLIVQQGHIERRGGEIEYELKLEEFALACVDDTAGRIVFGVGTAGVDAPFSVTKMPPPSLRYRGVRSER